MRVPSLKQLDNIRKNGFRPQVVGCIIKNKKILFLFDKKYKIWQLPQGGVDNKEDLKDALRREMAEELGRNFFKDYAVPKDFLLNFEEIEFPSKTQGSRELITDSGERINLRGKKYYFCLINFFGKEALDLKETEFDDYLWVSFKQANFLVNTIKQPGKRRITLELLNLLKEKGLIDNGYGEI